MRQKINIFKDAKKQSMAVDVNDMADPSMPQVTLEEMLDDLVIDDVEMADAWEGEIIALNRPWNVK